MINAFGPRAERYAQGLGDLEAIVAEPEHLLLAYIEAVRRRTTGKPFYGMVLLPDHTSKIIVAVGREILKSYPTLDERSAVLAQLGSGELVVNQKKTSEMFEEGEPNLNTLMFEFQLLCDAMLVRSFTEWQRISKHVKRPRPFERAIVVPRVPVVERRLPEQPSVVLWAPEQPAMTVAIHAFALSEFLGDVTVVSAGGEIPLVRPMTWTTADDPHVREALAVAPCVITVDSADPGPAVAFARQGYGVVAPMTCGAHEYVRNVQTYDLRKLRSIHSAVVLALGTPAEVRELPARAPLSPPLPAAPLPPDKLPLVSMVIPTYNRPEDLRRCLGYAFAQTYPNLEIVVVNDGGTPVEDVVAEFPGVRLHNLPKNMGVTEAEMSGIRAAAGRYIQLAADDDCIYPDHIERLVNAMERCGAAVGHTNGLIRQQRRMPDGSMKTEGFNAGVFMDTTTPTESLVSTPISGQGLMWRRDVFDEIGMWRDDCVLADQEFQLRAANRYVFVYVDLTTNEWRIRVGESYFAKYDAGTEMRNMFALHPRPNRPIVEQIREASIGHVGNRPKGGAVFPPTLSFEPGSID